MTTKVDGPPPPACCLQAPPGYEWAPLWPHQQAINLIWPGTFPELRPAAPRAERQAEAEAG